MAKGKGFSKNQKDWVQVEFCNVEMTAEQKKAFKALKQEEYDRLVAETVRMIEHGYKSSMTYDDDNSCFIFTLTCKYETDPNFNLCMSSRADDWLVAMALAAYKTRYCCPDGEWASHKRDFTFG